MRSCEQPPRVALLVVNYFSHAGVDDLLSSVVSNSTHSVVVSIVDNSCDESEAAALERVVSRHRSTIEIRLHPAAQNLGYAAGNNLAFATLEDDVDFIAVVNPDVIVSTGDLTTSILALGAEAAGAVLVPRTDEGARLVSGTSALQLWSGRSRVLEPGESPSRHEIVYPDGHFMVVPVSMWTELNGLDESYFLYCEEIDFALRSMRSKAFKIASLPDLTIRHVGGATTGSSKTKSAITVHHSNRSRLIAYRRHSVLRRHLPTLIAARVLYAALFGFRADFTTMRASLSGIWSGATAPLPQEPVP